MSGAPKQFDKNQVLFKALDQFWSSGYEGTSMQDLVAAMGINRASMYTTFGNKRDLFNQAFDCYCAQALENIIAVLQASDAELYNIEQFFVSLTTSQDKRISYGCFANNVAVELGPHDAGLAKKVRVFWQKIQDVLHETLKRAVEKKELAVDTDTESLARLINVTLQGLMAMRKAGVSAQQIQAAVQQLLMLFPKK
ncbi:MAG: TetR/AcrR family transcriptional regulator [Thiohalomonadales bacterium]